MPLLTPSLKFLVDENVRLELSDFLKAHGIAFKLVPKGAADKEVSQLSKKVQLILVTNDLDFAHYPKTKIFSVVLLRLSQNDPEILLSSFAKILVREKFVGKLIVLSVNRIEEYNLEENKEIVI